MKKFFLLFVCIFGSTNLSFAQEISKPAKLFNVEYPSYTENEGKALIERFQTDLKNFKSEIVRGGWDTYLSFGASKHEVTKEQFKKMLLGPLSVKEIEVEKVTNSGWSIKQQVYTVCTITVKKKMVCLVTDTGIPVVKLTSKQKLHGKVQPCLNIVWPVEIKDKPLVDTGDDSGEPDEEIVNKPISKPVKKRQEKKPEPELEPGDLPNNLIVYGDLPPVHQEQSQAQQIVLLANPQFIPTPSTVVGINPVAVLQLPPPIVLGGNYHPSPYYPSNPQTGVIWNGQPFTGNTTGWNTSNSNGSPFTGNTSSSGNTNSNGGPFTGNNSSSGAVFTGNGTVDGVYEQIP